jgi:hypothetical protein
MAHTLIPFAYDLIIPMAVIYGLLRLTGYAAFRVGRTGTHIFIWVVFAVIALPFVVPLVFGFGSGGAVTFHALMTPAIFLSGGIWLASAYAVFHSVGWAERRRLRQHETVQGA